MQFLLRKAKKIYKQLFSFVVERFRLLKTKLECCYQNFRPLATEIECSAQNFSIFTTKLECSLKRFFFNFEFYLFIFFAKYYFRVCKENLNVGCKFSGFSKQNLNVVFKLKCCMQSLKFFKNKTSMLFAKF